MILHFFSWKQHGTRNQNENENSSSLCTTTRKRQHKATGPPGTSEGIRNFSFQMLTLVLVRLAGAKCEPALLSVNGSFIIIIFEGAVCARIGIGGKWKICNNTHKQRAVFTDK
jgi:hypothetical protein